MKLIMAVSADGFVAKGLVDNMSWTGTIDKGIFKTLTLIGNRNLYAGFTTYLQLPKLSNREVWGISRDKNKGISLEFAYLANKDSWLIGGQTIALEAIKKGFINEIYLCFTSTHLKEGIPLATEISEFGKYFDNISFGPHNNVEIRKL